MNIQEAIEYNKKREKRDVVFYTQTETGRAYKKHVEVFNVAPKPYGYWDGRDDPALAKLYLGAIEKGVPLDLSSDTDIID